MTTAISTRDAKAERERLESEVSKRTDETIWEEARRRLDRAAGFGVSAWERAASRVQAESLEGRIAAYDAIVAERAKAERRTRVFSVG